MNCLVVGLEWRQTSVKVKVLAHSAKPGNHRDTEWSLSRSEAGVRLKSPSPKRPPPHNQSPSVVLCTARPDQLGRGVQSHQDTRTVSDQYVEDNIPAPRVCPGGSKREAADSRVAEEESSSLPKFRQSQAASCQRKTSSR